MLILNQTQNAQSADTNTRFAADPTTLINTVTQLVNRDHVDAAVIDLPLESLAQACAHRIRSKGIRVVAIDRCLPPDDVDLDVIPSFHLGTERPGALVGWPYFLIQYHDASLWQPGHDLLILTGSADALAWGQTLPGLIDKSLPRAFRVQWVLGPYADQPLLPTPSKHTWVIHRDVTEMRPLLDGASIVCCTYGVSFFEALHAGRPVITLSPAQHFKDEFECLKREQVCELAESLDHMVRRITNLTANPDRAAFLAKSARDKLDGLGGARIARAMRQI